MLIVIVSKLFLFTGGLLYSYISVMKLERFSVV